MDEQISKIKSVLSYDPETGVFTWIVRRNKIRAGSIDGTPDKDGYIQIRVFKKTYKAHRLAFAFVNGAFPTSMIDHKNRVKSDNRFSNLRTATNSSNAMNSNAPSTNTSGHKGVRFHSRDKVWSVRIEKDKKLYYVGGLKSKEEAIQARINIEIELYGEFSPHHPENSNANTSI